jgi:hypothetical protein
MDFIHWIEDEVRGLRPRGKGVVWIAFVEMKAGISQRGE